MTLQKPTFTFNDTLLQNNDIFIPFNFEDQHFIITFNNDQYDRFALLDNEGHSLDLQDFAHIFNFGKILLKNTNEFFIGLGIGSIFHKDKNFDLDFLPLRQQLFNDIQHIRVSKNFTY